MSPLHKRQVPKILHEGQGGGIYERFLSHVAFLRLMATFFLLRSALFLRRNLTLFILKKLKRFLKAPVKT